MAVSDHVYSQASRSLSQSIIKQPKHSHHIHHTFQHREGEVLARAWCAFHGFSAVVAAERDQEGEEGEEEEEGAGGMCMACAISQAYACCVNVVIYRGR